ncbi:MAG: hypothetical protein OXI46_03395 [Gemmatimonadota bacterium]|nr:hypothetical protein [Gemmatimonadota bacterium]
MLEFLHERGRLHEFYKTFPQYFDLAAYAEIIGVPVPGCEQLGLL